MFCILRKKGSGIKPGTVQSRCVPGREVSCSLLARLTPELSYAAEVLASLLILGLGFG